MKLLYYQIMRKFLIIFFIFGAFSLLAFQNRTVLAEKINGFLYQSPCDTPIPYRIGSIDTRFNIERDKLALAVEKAAGIWSASYGSRLFVLDPDADLTVSLSYDERQTLTNEISELDLELKDQKSVINPQIGEYKKRSDDFNTRINPNTRWFWQRPG